MINFRKKLEMDEKNILSPFASLSSQSRGRIKKEKKCSRCITKKKLPGFFHCDWYKDESERVCKDCRKLEVKMCNMCNTGRKGTVSKKKNGTLTTDPTVCVMSV